MNKTIEILLETIEKQVQEVFTDIEVKLEEMIDAAGYEMATEYFPRETPNLYKEIRCISTGNSKHIFFIMLKYDDLKFTVISKNYISLNNRQKVLMYSMANEAERLISIFEDK